MSERWQVQETGGAFLGSGGGGGRKSVLINDFPYFHLCKFDVHFGKAPCYMSNLKKMYLAVCVIPIIDRTNVVCSLIKTCHFRPDNFGQGPHGWRWREEGW